MVRKASGALVVRRRDRARPISALLVGGGQERGLRSGTVPVPLVVGLGEAARLARIESAQRKDAAASLKLLLLAALESVRIKSTEIKLARFRRLSTSRFFGVDSRRS